MPANLTPQYHEAEERYKKATEPAEKVSALEEMLRVIPKHKGTEKMQADLKRRLSRLRKDAARKPAAASQRPFYQIPREGAGRVLLAGPANSGKSQLLDSLTAASPEVADYPFTTRVPQAGMMAYEDIQIQLIDMPPLAPETLEAWQLAMLEQADVVLLMLDVNDPQLLDQTEFVLEKLGQRGIELSPEAAPRVVVLGNKVDQPSGEENFAAWQELYADRFRALPFSARRQLDREQLRSRLFELLEIVRVYTKRPGHGPEKDGAPYVLGKGSTILDAAAAVHKDMAENFKYARVWGTTLFDGQMVERTHVMEDGDVVEIHTG